MVMPEGALPSDYFIVQCITGLVMVAMMRSGFSLGALLLGGTAYVISGSVLWRSDASLVAQDAATAKPEGGAFRISANVVAYPVDDPFFEAARRKALDSLPRFLDLIETRAPGRAMVKFPLTQGGETENIWMVLTDCRDGVFTGLLANEPVYGARYQMGDRVTVAQSDIVDWMINTGGRVHGGYSVRSKLEDLPEDLADE